MFWRPWWYEDGDNHADNVDGEVKEKKKRNEAYAESTWLGDTGEWHNVTADAILAPFVSFTAAPFAGLDHLALANSNDINATLLKSSLVAHQRSQSLSGNSSCLIKVWLVFLSPFFSLLLFEEFCDRIFTGFLASSFLTGWWWWCLFFFKYF